MLANFTISILWLPVVFIIAAITGFLFRSYQINKARKRIIYLENEMLSNHAEILKLQQELVTLEKNSDETHKSRVVPMKENQEGKNENPDGSPRKKLNK